MHPRADFSHHYVTPGLLDAGIAVLNVNSRWLNNDATLIHEQVAARRRRRHRRGPRPLRPGGADRQQRRRVAVHVLPPPGPRARGRPPHPHRGRRRLRPQPVRPARRRRHGVPRRSRGRRPLPAARDRPVGRRRGAIRSACDPDLDLYDARNGFVEPPDEPRYATEFLDRYRAAQRARVERIDARARELVAARRAARAAWSGGTGTTARPPCRDRHRRS